MKTNRLRKKLMKTRYSNNRRRKVLENQIREMEEMKAIGRDSKEWKKLVEETGSSSDA